MKFIADENIGLAVVKQLRSFGVDVQSVIEIQTGMSDTKVLSIANKGSRILITTDKDFGELVYSKKLVHAGVILLRLRNESVENKFKILRSLLKTHMDELEKSFTVATESKIRIAKPLKLN